jgi:glycosyltransferase involved in cell wall biosynthesis
MIKKTSLVKISVLMSLFSEPENWLNEAIDSILNQTFTDFEFIIINDNPERELNHLILREYQSKDKRIVIINNEVNVGLTKSLNIGLKIAKGKYIARMDADDISLPERFSIQHSFLERNPNISILGTQIEFIGDRKGYWVLPCKPNEIKSTLFFKDCLAHPSVMMRRSDLKKHNFIYNEFFSKSQDYDLWVRTSRKLNLTNLNKVLLKYRVHSKQISTKNQKHQLELSELIKENQIKELDVNLTDKEYELIKSIWRKTFIATQEFIINLDKIYIKIRKANEEKLIFDKNCFNEVLQFNFMKLYILYITSKPLKFIAPYKLMTFEQNFAKIVFKITFRIFKNKLDYLGLRLKN